MNFDIRITFIILHAHVIARPVLLDQVHLQDQGFQLRTDYDPLDIGDIFYQLERTRMFLIIMEIGAHPGAQIDRFTHIDYPAVRIFHQVTASFVGQRIQDSLEMIGYGNHGAADSNTLSDQQPDMLSNL